MKNKVRNFLQIQEMQHLGTLRQKKTEVVAERKLHIYIFNLQYADDKFKTHSETLDFLEKLNFTVNPYRKVVSNIADAITKIEEIGSMRQDLSFGIDGAVIKVNDLEYREILGTTEKYPKWAVAYKYPPQQVETIIEKIELNVRKNRGCNSTCSI